ncbi:hypothetical protein [Carboxylicivirga sp. RSCT41]|uniref:hypothetical protein n=1 Tax=Carboxylicivirga agarovorans TaxID=3417570 RepID=UPI003D3444DD
MRNLIPLVTFLISILTFCHDLKAQHPALPSSSIHKDSLVQLYNNKFYNELEYINGREYKPYHYPTNETPYLHSKPGTGTIYIDGDEYPKKKLLYDIYKDLLVVNPEHYTLSNTYIQLAKSEVDSFTILFENQAYTFISLKDNIIKPGIKAGYYEQIYYSEQTSLLIRHFARRGVDNALPTYSYNTDRYLLKNGRYFNVTSKKKLLSLFPDDKKQLKKKIKSINLSYKKMSNIQLSQLLQFIDTL